MAVAEPSESLDGIDLRYAAITHDRTSVPLQLVERDGALWIDRARDCELQSCLPRACDDPETCLPKEYGGLVLSATRRTMFSLEPGSLLAIDLRGGARRELSIPDLTSVIGASYSPLLNAIVAIDKGPSGTGRLVRIDPDSGAYTALLTWNRSSSSGRDGLAVAPDGSIWMTGACKGDKEYAIARYTVDAEGALAFAGAASRSGRLETTQVMVDRVGLSTVAYDFLEQGPLVVGFRAEDLDPTAGYLVESCM